MRTSLIFILLFFGLAGHSLWAQVSGKLFIGYTQNVTSLADSVGYYQYPGGDFTSIASFSTRDLATYNDLLFCAPTPGPGGRYDSLQVIDIPTDQVLSNIPSNFTAGNVEIWNNKLVVSCGEAPYLRVLDTQAPFGENFNLVSSSDLPKAPFGMTVYKGLAYLWTDSLLIAVNLGNQQIVNTISFPAGFLVQSEFNAVLGAGDSAYLVLSMGRNMSFRDSVHIYHINLSQGNLSYRDDYVATGLLAFPGVSADDVIHFSRYRAHYDVRAGQIVPDVPGQTFLPGQASSYSPRSRTLVVMEEASFNRQFLWLEHADTIINFLSPLVLPNRTVIVWSSLFIDNLTLPVDPAVDLGIKLYPNPAKDIMSVETAFAGNYKLIDLHGKVVGEGKLRSGINTIDVHSLAVGTYTCMLFSKRHAPVNKLFIKKR